ncbi:hypothetical protein HO133_004878 [Letharia lupina]|uniref:Uncharacterized protein n=1 Tax=Letharia lupina TaxID=560253 RepID=A0A8H6L024_9LECA|nr:uncharacterized protein HO133_004878 [Letharia lupina]KAF6230534.1 hypothetical protein HO133_004878 [Letharia lupina]
MGAWGYGLFQSDNELDTIEEINEEAGKLANDPLFNFEFPKNHDEVVAKLNAGLFHQLLAKFQAKNWKHGIIYLGALSVQLGVKIGDEDMRVLRDTLPRTKMYDEARAQMQKGLDGYKNDGEAWHFESLGLEDTIQARGENMFPSSHGAMGMNVLQDPDKVPTPMPKDGDVEVDEEEEGRKKEKGPTGKDALTNKAKLKAWLSS